jgi:N-sulfoglucosamine sulfohydrolase
VYGVVPDRVYMPCHIPDTPQLREMMGRLQDAIRFLDAHVQRVFNAVERPGYRENTLVFFTNDHGIANMRAKSWLYDRGVEMALLMQMPGTIPQGQVVSELILNINIAPTILEAADVEIPPDMQGRSLRPGLTGGEYASHDTIYIEKNRHGKHDPVSSVRAPPYHTIRNFDAETKRACLPDDVPYMNDTFEGWFNELWPELNLARDEEELFDIVDDPDEFTNLAGDPVYREVQEPLSAQLQRWMEERDDPLLRGPIPPRLNPWPSQG